MIEPRAAPSTQPKPTLPLPRLVGGVLAVVLLAVVARDFAVATTFLGDDYVFRLFARLEDNPLVAFVSDKHGGEYYRPLPMALWWLLERLSHGRAGAFAVGAFTLHLLCAVLLATVARALGHERRTALLAGTLFFVSPAQREAALWFSASTDLLAQAMVLASLAAFLATARWGRAASVLFALGAFLCKETALVLPGLLLAAAWLRARQLGRSPSRKNVVLPVLPHLAAAVVVLGVRWLVLGGVGGTNDPVAPWFAWPLQLAAGLVHAVTAYAPLPEWLAWLVGGPLLVVAAVVAWRQNALGRFALVFVGLALLPLPAAGWVVGARYFYLPAAGLFLLVATALARASRLVVAVLAATLVMLGFLSVGDRAREVTLYREAVGVTERGVADGLAHGHRLFFVRGAVKDLDLALKLSPRLAQAQGRFVVIADVPASFVWLPPDLEARLRFLLAQPPLPPSGAYRFGGATIVGQARRDEAPDLDEVLTRMPELRIIQLRRQGGDFVWLDRTDEYRRTE